MNLACRSSVLLLILAAVSFGQGGGRGVAPAIDSIPNLNRASVPYWFARTRNCPRLGDSATS